MIEYYSQHPQYALLVVALAVVTLFVCIKAGKAASKHSRETNKLMNRLKEENKLINDFSILTADLIKSSDSISLFRGVALNLQKRVADKVDMATEFESLSSGQKYIYSIYTFIEDAENGMCNFFRMNTEPLTSTALAGIEIIADSEFSDMFREAYQMFDENNENSSFNKIRLEEIDKKTAPSIEDGTLSALCGEYIKNNTEMFL